MDSSQPPSVVGITILLSAEKTEVYKIMAPDPAASGRGRI